MKNILILFLSVTYNFVAQTNIKKIDSLLTYYNNNDKMMGQFNIKLANNNVYQNTFGSINNPKIEVNNETKYRIGSITKMFTATLIMLLVEEKKIKLSDKLSKFYPNINNATDITIEMLLKHRSGIPDYTNSENKIDFTNTNLKKVDIVNTINKYNSEFEPNSKAKYSNSNYFLLGGIIEQLTHKSYNENLINRICKPLNLYYTHVGNHELNRSKNEVGSYIYRDYSWQSIPDVNVEIPDSAGGIISTARDLTSFIYGLFSYKLVKKETLDLMIKTQDGFGLGITQIPFGDRIFYGHAGRIDGNLTSVTYYPAEKMSYAALYNGVNSNTNEINIGVLSIYYHQPYTFPDFIDLKINPNILKKYEGIYKSETLPIKIKVFIHEEKLFAQATGQSHFPLTAKSETEFSFEPAKIKITFKNNELILNQSNVEYLFTKE
jgi:CubicO group peptidase (beta-lactamase class C family)